MIEETVPARIRCGRCRASFDPSAWRRLATLRVLRPTDVRELADPWPSDAIIRVRACSCGAPIARLEPALSSRV